MNFIYPAVFRKGEDGKYHASFPDLECCEAVGDTLDDAIDNANDAARSWLSVELEEEEPELPCVSDMEDIPAEEDSPAPVPITMASAVSISCFSFCICSE